MAKKVPATTRFSDAAKQLGFVPDVVRFPADTRTAEQAAGALGCVVDQIVKSLVFRTPDGPLLVLTSGANVVDVEALGDAAGVEPGRADAAEVRVATGFAIGGVPPFGHPERHRTIIDPHLCTFPTVWAAAGAPDSVFEIAASRLVELTAAEQLDCFVPST